MVKLSKGLRNQILEEVLKLEDFFGGNEEESSLMEFLSLIWDLQSMPSEDPRFNDAYDDIFQHVINNHDWTYEILFKTRLGLLNSDSKFETFLNTLLKPEIRENEDDIMSYFYLIEPYLSREGFTFSHTGYNDSDLPIYEVSTISANSDDPIGIRNNDIPFFVEFEPNGLAHYSNSYQDPEVFPSFALVLNNGWNDFKVTSSFYLYYHPNEVKSHYIGNVKIIHNEVKNIAMVMPNKFKTLDNNFCALGQNMPFYENLKTHLGVNFESVLWAIRDAAFFTENDEAFDNNQNFNDSLIRDNEPERLLREAKYRIYDYDLSNLYSFTYKFEPKFADNDLNVKFDFKNSNKSFDRIYAIIGKNGTGKTQLITSLPIDISRKENKNFTPRTPLFSKVIAVSYSVFDSFEIPRKTASFNYQYCGLKDERGNEITDRGLLLRFHNTRKKIDLIGRFEEWLKILKNFIDEESITKFIYKKTDEDAFLPESEYTFDLKEFGKVRKQLSSGQSIVLYIITEIVANIRFDSIILYDEPETHLHPNAISQLMNTIYELINEFQSYCIIATHSPLIIRELLSKNVYVIERESRFSSIRKISIESFGENLSTLTDEVFGNREIPKQYKMILRNMVDQNLSYEDIVNELKSDGIPMSLNTSIYLKNLMDAKS
jgi:ABC-type nitrate/sulfonate/bicarbonate transport system ATPase subunit